MVKRGIFIVIILMGVMRLEAQELSHQVLVPMASTWQGEGITVGQTVGEAVVAYLPGETRELTQGFQQPSVLLVALNPPEGNGVNVYPNPAKEFLKIEMFGDITVNYTITIFCIDGSVYFRKDYNCSGVFWRIETLDISEFKKGLYLVRVESTPRKIERMFKIEKM